MRLLMFERRPGAVPASGRGGELREAYRGLEDLDERPTGGCRVAALLDAPPSPPGADPLDLVDLHRALALLLASEDAGAPEAEAASLLPAAPLPFLMHFPTALASARRAIGFVHEILARFPATELAAVGVLESTRRVTIHAPVPRPGKVVAVARNYGAHADEVGAQRPGEPVLFLEAPSAVIGPGAPIRLPDISEQVDYEGELAAVIGRPARNVRESHALEYVAGYTAANDVSARDWQGVRGQHWIGKSFDGFLPMGPVLVTSDAIADPQDLRIGTRVSGETLQNGHTKEMIFPVAALIAFASRILTLEPGDILLTGTPSGVGKARTPPRWLRPGDEVEVEIERIGTLRSPVTSGG